MTKPIFIELTEDGEKILVNASNIDIIMRIIPRGEVNGHKTKVTSVKLNGTTIKVKEFPYEIIGLINQAVNQSK